MTYDAMGQGALNYFPCRYGTSKVLFRGPRKSLKKPYIAFFGGTETYGKFLARPFPDLLEESLGMPCVNLGCTNAGVEVFASDPQLSEIGAGAKVTVLQVLSAQNMTNRFYSVHPRRNDRFLKPSGLLEAIFRDVDFAEFNFNKHMLIHLNTVSPERFRTVREELQSAWIARMRHLLARIPGKTVLLWFGQADPDNRENGMNHDPWFVTREMIETLRNEVTEIVEVQASEQAMEQGTDGMVFSEMERQAAETMLGPVAHQEAAAALEPVLRRLVGQAALTAV
ncbi:DUF6473 family protein [Pseudosulfitobacter sp. DSM 107133]|uniref:DUF6473 family protein n=1 Tax=Pseudosulfitobacter sp. DSM 107133 TaxID=2883100 RepID=UPI000DF2046A|nr:DUF6473 family protein [Pseudosulfitobacter sp. DSM 107133]UOA28364.1 hypothetical protein DSM107133_03111 [Pseudosulfitobacter sp. DSM 107133]